jgi:hypothetical protein
MAINKISEKDLSYIAGFFDADGSAIAQFKANNTCAQDRPYQIQLTVQFSQKLSRRFLLDNFAKIIGAGKVRVREDMADLVIVSARDVCDFLQLIQPLLRLKQKQANLLIRLVQQMPGAKTDITKFIQLCDLVDQVAGLNDSRNRLITGSVVIAHMRRLLSELACEQKETSSL